MTSIKSKLGLALLFFPTSAMADADIDKIYTGQIGAYKDRSGIVIEMVVSNTSEYSGDVLIWVRQNGIRKCEYVGRLSAKQRYDLKMPCDSLTGEKYEIRMAKPEEAPHIAAIAERL